MKIKNCKLKILILSSILYLLSSLFITTQPIYAAETTTNPYAQSNLNPDVPKNLNTWTQTVMIEVMNSLSCQLAGSNPGNVNQSCLGVDSKTGKIGLINSSEGNSGGAVGVMSHLIGGLYNIPIHTGEYTSYLAQNFGIVNKAHAQTSTGFKSLKPLIKIWTIFRNIVYLAFTLIFVVIGLAIMFRVKIDPRTVMTIQNQIPKIIIGIILVTFSYAIAGFLVDIMWLMIYLMFNLLSPVANLGQLNPAHLQGNSPFGALGGGTIWDIMWNSSRGIGDFISSLLGSGGAWSGGITSAIPGAAAGATIGALAGPIGAFIGGSLGGIIGGFGIRESIGFSGGIIALIIIGIALLWALFRLWFTLIVAYVHILIAVVLAPFWIAGGLIPGSSINFSGWLKDIIANLLAFPVTIGMFLLGAIFMDVFGTENSGQFIPPLIGNPGDTNAIGSIIGLGVILMTPNVVNMMKTALKAPKVDLGTAMQAIGVGTGAIPGLVGRGSQLGSTFFGLSHLPRVSGILKKFGYKTDGK